MNQQLDQFLRTISITSNTLSDLIDVEKIISNVDKVEMDLNSLNYLITQNEQEFNSRILKLYKTNPTCFSTLPILIGVRDAHSFHILLDNATIFIDELLNSVENIKYFFYETNLWNLIKDNKIRNFVDFVTGVELGLDSNSRKNRVGAKRETYIKNLLETEFRNHKYIEIKQQVKVNINNKTKKFDFVVTNKLNNRKVYIECSYYTSSGGSKISETARAYNELNHEIKNYNSSFIWLADGKGIYSVKKLLFEFSDTSYIVNTNQLISKIKQELDI